MVNGPFDDSCIDAAAFREIISAVTGGRSCVVATEDMAVQVTGVGGVEIDPGTAIIPGPDGGSYIVCFSDEKPLTRPPGDRVDCVVVHYDGTCEVLLGTQFSEPALPPNAIKLARLESASNGSTVVVDARTFCSESGGCMTVEEFDPPVPLVPGIANPLPSNQRLPGVCTWVYQVPDRLVTNPNGVPIIVKDYISATGGLVGIPHSAGTVPPNVTDWPLCGGRIEFAAPVNVNAGAFGASTFVQVENANGQVVNATVTETTDRGLVAVHCHFAPPC